MSAIIEFLNNDSLKKIGKILGEGEISFSVNDLNTSSVEFDYKSADLVGIYLKSKQGFEVDSIKGLSLGLKGGYSFKDEDWQAATKIKMEVNNKVAMSFKQSFSSNDIKTKASFKLKF